MTHVFSPESAKPFSHSRATAARAKVSEPAPSSEMAKAPSARPLAMAGSHLSLLLGGCEIDHRTGHRELVDTEAEQKPRIDATVGQGFECENAIEKAIALTTLRPRQS